MVTKREFFLFTSTFLTFTLAKETGEIKYVNIDKETSFLLKCPVNDGDYVLWYKDDQELDFSERFQYPSGSSVKITKVTKKDEGVYSCQDPIDAKTVKTILVKIVDSSTVEKTPGIAPQWKIAPEPKHQIDNRTPATIACRANGEPKPKVEAYKLNDDGSIAKEFPNGGFYARIPGLEHAGKYRCIATNDAGSIQHDFEVSVVVHGGLSEWGEWSACSSPCGYGRMSRTRACNKPQPANGGDNCEGTLLQRRGCKGARKCSKPRLVKFGYDVSSGDLLLHCVAAGLPMPSTSWTYRGKPLPSRFTRPDGSTVIPKSKVRSGEYGCLIKNTHGFYTAKIHVLL